jgi:hypothetical protein
MPEDMKELFRQRQRELAAERAQFALDAEKDTDTTLPAANTEPKLEQVTLPPPPKAEEAPVTAPGKVEPVTPRTEAPPPPLSRPREVDVEKKKGKKGEDEP